MYSSPQNTPGRATLGITATATNVDGVSLFLKCTRYRYGFRGDGGTTMRHRLWLMTAILLLTACGGSEPPPAQPPPEPKPTVFDPLTQTIDRAKAVQQTVDDQAAELRKRVEEAER